MNATSSECSITGWTAAATGISDRVLDEVADRIARQPQRPRGASSEDLPRELVSQALACRRGGRRDRPSAAVFVRGDHRTGRRSAAPSPAPSLSPVASASPSAAHRQAPFPVVVPPGTATGPGSCLRAPGRPRPSCAGSTFSVPEGWVNDFDTADFYGLLPGHARQRGRVRSLRGLAQHHSCGTSLTPRAVICEESGRRGSDGG